MSTNLKDEYSELLALSQLFLHREYPRGAWKMAESETYHFFRERVERERPKKAPPPKKAAPPPPKPMETPPSPKPMKTPPPPNPPPGENKNLETSIKLELMDPPSTAEFDDLKKVIKDHFPAQTILEEVPDPSQLQLKRDVTDVMIITFESSPKHRQFLQNIATAITAHGIPTSVVKAAHLEKTETLEALLKNPKLRLVIANGSGIENTSSFKHHFREVPKIGRSFLGRVPLCLLTDLSLYLKEPHLKVSLWNAIQDLLRQKRS